MTTRTVTSGWLTGHAIRRARKAGPCQYGPMPDGTRCQVQLRPGDDYVEGDPDPSVAGGFGGPRYCLAHLDEGA